MSLMEQVSKAITEAMKAKDPVTLVPLRMLKAALMNREIERGQALSDAEAQQVLTSLVKQRRDSIEQFTRGGRTDLADKEAAEIKVLQAYLPPAMEPEELQQIVDQVVAETGATSPKDIGKVMKGVMARIPAGAADGKVVNELARKRLSG